MKGFTLLEVLVSLIIFAIGFLGLAGMQMMSMRDNHTSYLRTKAVFLTTDITDKIRANTAFAYNQASNFATITPTTNHVEKEDLRQKCSNTHTSGDTCDTPQELGAFDLSEWDRRVKDSLPGAGWVICFDSTPWNTGSGLYPIALDSNGNLLDDKCDDIGGPTGSNIPTYTIKLWWLESGSVDDPTTNENGERLQIIITSFQP